ncbi:phenylalanine--tRNA ligase subunit beta [Qipengyuania qiaonensis]|uniref:Phenylalanine--tRNA ligase beta subunit n=1 Tax=Qipengyuania qiaonensis TaxID=2867240 RepID=A0ABS7J4U6_9SPHN|nr:phenylalanine--tRNA ligase subunit beta [Qipengyuania qiaonensis]MBX7482375.1 phenylalanine--tRNA ligase subunit beta [Qipengyuania qiaonensis]
MKFSLNWLKVYLTTEADAATIAATLNAIGHEVEGIDDPAERFAGFRIAEVLTAAPHPDADKLQVLTVDTGEGEPLQVVCGAPNARAGMKGVLGLPGAVVPANGMELRKSAIRGVESNGMMCSVRELELGEEHDGIIELPGDAPVGTDFAIYRGTSPVFDVAITPNRPDCMGVYGIARDLAAAGLGTLKPPRIDAVEGRFPCPVAIRTEDPEGCPAFYGRVIRGVTNGASPEWLANALLSAGQRPISAIVDLTNFMMLSYGRPAHAYDLAKLTGTVVARRAVAGEQIEALNEKTYTLDETMTVIADEAGVHDIAGIMGGEHSSVTPETSDVLLEIAYFDPERIGVTGRKLGLASDARTRFERGVDPAFLDDGLALLSALILELCGGEASDVVRAGAPPKEPRIVTFDPGLTRRLGGVEVAEDEQRRILEALDFRVDEAWQVTCPPRRHDIEGPADLVEEVVRIHGLDKVESVALPRAEGVAKPTATPLQLMERKLRRAAAARGLDEAITWSFISEREADLVGGGPWVLDNPISEEMKVMRPSLLPGLLSAARRNLARGASSLRLFEIGRRYLADGEHPSLAFVLVGDEAERGWKTGKPRTFDAYDAKALVLDLLAAAGAPVGNLMVMGEAGEVYHPGQSATLRLGPKNRIASFGAVHPALLKAFDIDVPVMAGGIHLDAIPVKKGAPSFARAAYAPPALQAIGRDFAFLVPADLAAADLVRVVKGADKKAVVDARVFDVFAGQGVPEGRKSVALEVTLQPGEKSFTDVEIKAISDKVVAAAAKQGAELRG